MEEAHGWFIKIVIENMQNRLLQNITNQVWTLKTSHADNHYLDCEVYCLAAADILGVRTLHLTNIEEEAPQTTVNSDKQEYTPEENWINSNESWI